MPKVAFKCDQCGSDFDVWPAQVRHNEKRGAAVRFCSKACKLQARRDGKIAGKKVRGEELTCEMCSKKFHRTQSHIKNGRSRFCSNTCRHTAERLKLVDRHGPRPMLQTGHTIACKICGKERHRKQSMIDRNISQTCGSRACISAYGRSLWGLEPKTQAERSRGIRSELFSPKQRLAWLDDKCAHCGTTENLTLDHILAVCCGGKSTRDNAQTLCGRCNNIKCRTVDLPLARKQAQSGG